MPEIHVGKEIIGKRLENPVYSSYGGLLYPAGHQLREKDVEFLLAFKIESIPIEAEKEESEEPKRKRPDASAKKTTKDEEDSFLHSFRSVMKEMDKAFMQVMAGGKLPILEIRTWLKPFLDRIDMSTGWIYAFQENSVKNYLSFHAIGTALVAVGIARSARMPEKEWMQIALAGLLCNIGMVKVPAPILLKEGPLSKEEWEEIRRHPLNGYEILKNVKGLTEGVSLSALQHHERLNGIGYPLGLSGEKIHPYAKVIAIADVLHAVSSNRPHRLAQSPYRFLEEMRQMMTDQFDTGYIHALIQSLFQLPLGTPALLSDGRIARILYIYPNSPLRPVVSIGNETISLMERKELSIDRILVET